jgi:hypothetical protein
MLSDLEQLNEIISLSSEKPVVIFKHGVLAAALCWKEFVNSTTSQISYTLFFDLITS